MTSILIVEDDKAIAMGLEDDLRLDGYDVAVARDGEQAVNRARERAFDLIVLDIMLPRKDGYQVCRELRHSGVATPIIMLTARAQDAEKVLGLEIGADDYVTKPFNPMELRARIRAVLRRTSGPLPERFTFGDVQVDFRRCEVRRAGALVDMSNLEFKLLTAFIEQRGRVLSRDQLLDAAWGREVHVTVALPGAVDYYERIEVRPFAPGR